MSTIFVYVEHKDNNIRKASLEAVCAGAKIAKLVNAQVTAIVLGADLKEEALQKLGTCGATKVLHIDDAIVNTYSSEGYASILGRLAKAQAPWAFLFSATAQGKDLAPRVAALLDEAMFSDCTELNVTGGKITAKRPVYAGKAYAAVETLGKTFIATLRPNVFMLEQINAAVKIEKIPSGISAVDCKSKVKEFKAAAGEKLDVSEAPIIVSGGRGLQGPENWHLVEDLAKALGGAIGASRAVVDAGWRPHAEQVGQTGKTVAPVLYVACGISGAIQHLAGMRTSKYIVAINKDAEAPIFKIANYGIVGDILEILPALTAAVKEAKKGA